MNPNEVDQEIDNKREPLNAIAKQEEVKIGGISNELDDYALQIQEAQMIVGTDGA